MKKLILAAVGLAFAISAPANSQAAGKPLELHVSSVTVDEGKTAAITISKSGGNGRAVTVDWNTSDVSAKAPGDYLARSGRNTLGSVPITVVVPTVDNSAVEGRESFSVTAKVVSGSVHPSATGTVTIADNDVATPVPAPAPVPSGFVPSPSLDGAAYVPDNADPQLALQPSWGSGAIPPSSKPDVIGALRFICTAGQVLADDPIVYPGQPGKSHLHQFYGNTAADAYSTYFSLRTKGQSTCNRGVANPMNRSGYWMPAMLDALGVVVKPSFAIIYYKRRPITDPKCSLTSGDPQAEGDCLTIPNGLRFIFGYDMVSNTPATGSAWFNCQGPTSVPGHYANLALALANCPAGAGNQVGAIIEAPTCWDGKNLDSPNHRSHMGYPSYGSWGYLKCPADHHYVIPAFTLGAWYPVVAGMHLSCDAMLPNAPAGTCWHADYWEAWNEKVKAMWTDNDINKQLNASGGDLGNGLQMKGAQ